MKKTVVIFILVVFIIGVYFAINNENKVSKNNEKITVVTSFYPLYYFVSQIVGDNMEIINIGRNNDPHDFVPSAKDMITMQNADLVLLQGGGLESWGKDLEQQLISNKKNVFIVSQHIKLHKKNKDGSDKQKNINNDKYKIEHNHDFFDPHTWLDPILAKQTVLQITDELIKLDDKNKELYTKNSKILTNKLSDIDKLYSKSLSKSNCATDKALVSHNAFGYIGRRYNLQMYPIAGLSTSDKPSAKLLKELKKEAQNGVIAILTEENSIKKYAQTISKETNIKLIPINALATGVIKNGGDYLDGLYYNLDSFKKAYGCTK